MNWRDHPGHDIGHTWLCKRLTHASLSCLNRNSFFFTVSGLDNWNVPSKLDGRQLWLLPTFKPLRNQLALGAGGTWTELTPLNFLAGFPRRVCRAGTGEVIPQGIADTSIMTGVGLRKKENQRDKKQWQWNMEMLKVRSSVTLKCQCPYIFAF